MKKKLSIIIPIFNEINLLERFFYDLFSNFENLFVEYIIVDDGSYDGTENWLSQYIKPLSDKKISKIYVSNDSEFLIKIDSDNITTDFSNIKLLQHKKNLGKGAAVKTALKNISGDYIVIFDADLEYDPIDPINMFNLIQKGKMGEVIFGSRYSSDLPHRHRYILNSFVNRLNTFIFNIFFDSAISDIHCGLKIFSKNVYEKINLTSNDFSFELDLGSQISKAGFDISEVGVRYYSRTYLEGKKITWVDGLKSYWYLFKFRFIENNFKRNVMIIFSFFTGGITGAHFGDGIGTILAIIFGLFIGGLFGTRYSYSGLLCVIIGLLIGSEFSKGNGKIFTVLLGGFTGYFFARKIESSVKKPLNK